MNTLIKYISILATIFALTAEAGSRPMGSSCTFDGQCTTRECKYFKCVDMELILKPLGKKCLTDGQCQSGECKQLKCINPEGKTIGPANKILNVIMNKFDKILPILKKSGFEPEKVSIDVKLIPIMSVNIKQVRKISKNQQKLILKSLKGRIFASSLMKALFSAHNLEFDNYKVGLSKITLSVPPKTTISLIRK